MFFDTLQLVDFFRITAVKDALAKLSSAKMYQQQHQQRLQQQTRQRSLVTRP